MKPKLHARLRQGLTALCMVYLLASCGHQAPSPMRSSSEAALACETASLTNPLSGGLGGTGAPRMAGLDPGGLGGTGQVAAEGGLGGTGIVGVVTGFASICINGLEVAYGPGVAVSMDGDASNAGELAVGQVVALDAQRSDTGLHAQRIEVLDSVVGPIAALNRETGRFALLGQIALAQEPSDLAGMIVGDWVRVSGLTRASGEIRATRVQRAERGKALLRGQVSDKVGNVFMIGGARIDGRQLRWIEEVSNGQEVQVRGAWNGVQFEAISGTLEPTQALIQRSREVVLEGYVQSIQGQELALDYARITLINGVAVTENNGNALSVGQKIQVHGKVGSDRRVVVDRVQLLRESRRGESSRSQTVKGSVGVQSVPSQNGSGNADSATDDSSNKGGNSGKGSSNRGSGSSGSGSGKGNSGSSGSSGSGSSGSGSGSSGGSGKGTSGGSGSSGSGSSGSGSSGSSGSGGGGSSGSGSSGSGGSGSSGSGKGSSGGSGSSGGGNGKSG